MFQDGIDNIVNYEKNLNKATGAQRGLNYDTKQYGEYLKTLAKYNNIDINTEQGKKHLSRLIKERDGFSSDKVKTTLVQYLKLKWQPDDPMGQLEGWRKDLQSWLGANTLVITAEDNMDDVIKNIQTKYKSLKENTGQMKPILIKAGIDFNGDLLSQLKNLSNPNS